MEKRYQVFVSSTYQDLQDERQEVIQALLELDCMPAGMELFPAANDEQWTLIKKVIDECDYYVVIVGGRYGAIGPDGLSYTEMEYRYAASAGKPTIAFLHKDAGSLPSSRCEPSEDGRAKLDGFREVLKTKLVRFWDSPADLGSQVSRSLVKLIKSNPAVGWARADSLDPTTADEVLKLRKRVEELESQLAESRHVPPPGTEVFAQKDDTFALRYSFLATDSMNIHSQRHQAGSSVSWDSIFAQIAPLLIDEGSESQIQAALDNMVRDSNLDELRKDSKLKKAHLKGFSVLHDDLQTIKVQLRALGLIQRSERNRSVKDRGTYWTLTPYGDQVLTQLRAIRRQPT